jgi:signal transduction histidine kinase
VPPVINIRSQTVSGEGSGLNVSPEEGKRTFHLIAVEDNGIGFEQEYAERIFGMFTRLHGNREYTGSGIGLAIVKKVVENHNGYIWAESEPGKGATFRVLLPVE